MTGWNPDVVFPVLADPIRRRVLLALANGEPKTATQLTGASSRRLDATLKHLLALRNAGLVITRDDPVDSRRQLYSLSPAVPLTKTEKGIELDFGFVLLRIAVE